MPISFPFKEENSTDYASLKEPKKMLNGSYGLFYSDKVGDMYLELLNKLKADLLLTMFLRGGAPIVK